MSGVEISFDNGQLKIIQRDIFSGAIIEITNDGYLDLLNNGKLKKFGQTWMRKKELLSLFNFDVDLHQNEPRKIGPIGMKTGDLYALFNFDTKLSLSFVPDSSYLIVKGMTTGMTGVIGCYICDELSKFR